YLSRRWRSMTYDELITLISITQGEDEAGYPVDAVETRRDVLANKKSVTRSEFYAANQSGLRADIAFVVHGYEYNGERFVEHNGKRYEVIRTFEVSFEEMEIICTDISQGA